MHKPPAVVVQAQQEPAPPPQPPPPPPTPEQGPSSPPDVNYQRGQLTITARNSTMSDVLNAVKQKTGAAVDMPTVTSERVVGVFGPGAPRDVMAQLLNGSHYDYVLLGSPTDPGALKKIVLTARASGPEPAPALSQPQMANQPLQAVPEVETEQSSDDASSPDVAQPDMQQPPEEEAQPDQSQPDQSQPGQPGQPVVKTPEQLLRELQQQQQQMQQNGPPEQQK
ncbi:MAG TPA: hypothetical protein VF133_03955 [Terriglobales bacterium]